MKRSQPTKGICRMLPLLLFAALLLCLAAPACAMGDSSQAHADTLNTLGLFRGVGTAADGSPVYDLESAPNRLHGLVMLIRLLGRESAALAAGADNPFADVNAGHDAYGVPYVAYAYAEGLTKGSSATTYNPDAALTARDYVTFLLRALGYDDKAGDFSWAQALSFAASIDLIAPDSVDALESRELDRGDMVDLSYAALTYAVKDGSGTLARRLCAEGVFTEAQGKAAGILDSAGWRYALPGAGTPAPVTPEPTNPEPATAEPVTYEARTVHTSTGDLRANVIAVDLASPRVRVRSAMVDGTLSHTANFADIVAASGCFAAVNGNFFTSNEDFKRPLGHVMADGQFLYANSGFSSLGIYRDGRAAIGRLPVFDRISDSDGHEWAAYEVNTVDGQGEDASVLYLPSYGRPVEITAAGSVMVVRGNVIREWRDVAPGELVEIPADGFVFYAGSAFMAAEWNHTPIPGSRITGVQPYLFQPTADSFSLDGIVSIVSGGPRLVTDGRIDETMESAFSDQQRFGPNAASARTAVGLTPDGSLLLVSVPGATIQQMRELMLALGCEDAFNLDGGASCGMYCQGKMLATPGRALTTTLQVFLDP